MNQKRARYERRLRQEWYEYQLKRWLLRKPPWWRFDARRKWKAEKPSYIRRRSYDPWEERRKSNWTSYPKI